MKYWGNWRAGKPHLKSVPQAIPKRRMAGYNQQTFSGQFITTTNDTNHRMTMKVRKAIFPAAGLGTRFLPATKAQPKEMLTLVDKPIIQYGVEEAMHSGVQNIIIVTGRGKTTIEDHFDVSFELENLLETRHKK